MTPLLDPNHATKDFGNIGSINSNDVTVGIEKLIAKFRQTSTNQAFGNFIKIPVRVREKAFPTAKRFVEEKAGTGNPSDAPAGTREKASANEALEIRKTICQKGLTKAAKICYQYLWEE